MDDDVKVTVLPYIPPPRKAVTKANERTRLDHEAHQKHLDSLMHEPSGEEGDDLLCETEKNFRDGMRWLDYAFALDRKKHKA